MPLLLWHTPYYERYKPRNTKIELTVVIDGKQPNIKLPQGYFFKKLPRTKAYVTTYTGPFDFITLIYEKLHELKITEKLPVRFTPFDVHLNGLSPNISNYQKTTKICFPLK